MSIRFLEPEDVLGMMLIGFIIIIPIISLYHDCSAEEPETSKAIQVQAACSQPAMVQQCPHQCPYHHGGGQRQ